ncbi:S-methyl-5'-thioinosine phosphorylase [Gammaproteobacteria bacterium]|jgi:5'-methylthioinosine phosphorylase|nr:S-methyl-5'-thioinosine phosphorylase [Gammaproteobacteria bacterium]MDC1284495.1 S-methyl-5'-thioinosine phosphorylase [Gammaproteobacteria bacterium]
MSAKIAIIGGTGLKSFPGLKIIKQEVVRTPYGTPSGPISHGEYADCEVIFIPRHGSGHTIPPHMINYRANLWALREKDIKSIVAVAAVGSIHTDIYPTRLVIPEQIIDYTYGRPHTFFEQDLQQVKHIDFSQPYDEALRQSLMAASVSMNLDCYDGGCYAATQGPRLESAAEINRLERDGCDIVGMTGMPEAALARELDMAYAHCAMSVNWAAGRSQEEITMELIMQCTQAATKKVQALIGGLLQAS